MTQPKSMYRVEFKSFEDIGGELYILHYNVIKETPCGYWILPTARVPGKRWMKRNAERPFAFPSVKEALEDFIRRNDYYIRSLQWRLRTRKYIQKRLKHHKNECIQELATRGTCRLWDWD